MRFLLLSLIVTLLSCTNTLEVDLIVFNAKIYTVNQNFEVAEAFAVKEGKFLNVGTNKNIGLAYYSKKRIDAKGKTILPGLIDAHCHFYGLGLQQQRVDLTATQSFEEVIERVNHFQKKRKTNFIIGRGWDQNDWKIKMFPNKNILDSLFPTIPVALTRIDGHAMLCNQAALDLANISIDTKIEGGDILIEEGKLTGILIDNPMDYVIDVFPKPSKQQQIQALLEAQKICLDYGLTTVDDAGLDRSIIELIDSLQQVGDLKIRIYAMLSNTKTNLDYYLPKGKIKTNKLNVSSVKAYADGALGSRGAVLKKPYTDKKNHFGAMVINPDEFKILAQRLAKSNYQLNTHAIGDSANSYILNTYKKVLSNDEDRRWRIEHAQVISKEDFKLFNNKNILPSIQPTHATSDMYWAETRLGSDRAKGAYAYSKLLETHGKVALGTDFPVEKVSPFLTFYAAVARKDSKGFPDGGYQSDNKLTREETLKGMTIWAAYANFEEREKGSIETGKFADFIIINQDIMKVQERDILKTKVEQTFINGVAQ